MYGAANATGPPTPQSTRHITVIRQWCLPLLFWVSGASMACSYKGGVPRGLGKLLAISAVGMCCNAFLWYTSPQNRDCIIDTPACQGKGIIFDFSICGRAGWWFAILFQMWYTLVLVVLCLLNW